MLGWLEAWPVVPWPGVAAAPKDVVSAALNALPKLPKEAASPRRGLAVAPMSKAMPAGPATVLTAKAMALGEAVVPLGRRVCPSVAAPSRCVLGRAPKAAPMAPVVPFGALLVALRPFTVLNGVPALLGWLEAWPVVPWPGVTVAPKDVVSAAPNALPMLPKEVVSPRCAPPIRPMPKALSAAPGEAVVLLGRRVCPRVTVPLKGLPVQVPQAAPTAPLTASPASAPVTGPNGVVVAPKGVLAVLWGGFLWVVAGVIVVEVSPRVGSWAFVAGVPMPGQAMVVLMAEWPL